MAVINQEIVREFVRGMLPSGPFWSQPGEQEDAAERFVRSVSAAFIGTGSVLDTPAQPGVVDFVCTLDAIIDPARTPYRSVLLQYYEYLQIPECTPIPADLEELRAIVVQANSARPVYTPSGLKSWIESQLPLVEVNESLPLAVLPFEVPKVDDGWWAVVEIWYTPFLNSAENILCVARPVVQGSNDIRLVQPQAFWSLGVPQGPSIVASEVALLWDEQRPTSTFIMERFDAGMLLLEIAILSPVLTKDVMTGDQIFPLLGPSTVVSTEIWRVRNVGRDFPGGLGSFQTMGATTVTLP